MEKPEALQLSLGERQNLLTQPVLRTERVQMMLRSTVLSILSKEIPANYIVSKDDLENLRRMLVGIENDLHKILPFLQSSYPQPGWDELIAKTQEMLTKASERLDENLDLHSFDDDALQAAVIAVATRLKEMALAFDEMELDDVTVLEQTEKIRRGVTQDMLLADDFVRVPVVEKPKPVIRFETNGSVWDEIEASYEPPVSKQPTADTAKEISDYVMRQLLRTHFEEETKIPSVRLVTTEELIEVAEKDGWFDRFVGTVVEQQKKIAIDSMIKASGGTYSTQRALAEVRKKSSDKDFREHAENLVRDNLFNPNNGWLASKTLKPLRKVQMLSSSFATEYPAVQRVAEEFEQVIPTLGDVYRIPRAKESDDADFFLITPHPKSNFKNDYIEEAKKTIASDSGEALLDSLNAATNNFFTFAEKYIPGLDKDESREVVKHILRSIRKIIRLHSQQTININGYDDFKNYFTSIRTESVNAISAGSKELPAQLRHKVEIALKEIIELLLARQYAFSLSIAPSIRPDDTTTLKNDPNLAVLLVAPASEDKNKSNEFRADLESYFNYDLASIPTVRIIDYPRYLQWLKANNWIEKLTLAMAKDKLATYKKQMQKRGRSKQSIAAELDRVYQNNILPKTRAEIENIYLAEGGEAERDSIYNMCKDDFADGMATSLREDGVSLPNFHRALAQMVRERITLGHEFSLPGIANMPETSFHTFHRTDIALSDTDAMSSVGQQSSQALNLVEVNKMSWIYYAQEKIKDFGKNKMTQFRCEAIFDVIAGYFRGQEFDNSPIETYDDLKRFHQNAVQQIRQIIADGMTELPSDLQGKIQETLTHFLTMKLAVNYATEFAIRPLLRPTDQSEYENDPVLEVLRTPERIGQPDQADLKADKETLATLQAAYAYSLTMPCVKLITFSEFMSWAADNNWQEKMVAALLEDKTDELVMSELKGVPKESRKAREQQVRTTLEKGKYDARQKTEEIVRDMFFSISSILWTEHAHSLGRGIHIEQSKNYHRMNQVVQQFLAEIKTIGSVFSLPDTQYNQEVFIVLIDDTDKPQMPKNGTSDVWHQTIADIKRNLLTIIDEQAAELFPSKSEQVSTREALKDALRKINDMASQLDVTYTSSSAFLEFAIKLQTQIIKALKDALPRNNDVYVKIATVIDFVAKGNVAHTYSKAIACFPGILPDNSELGNNPILAFFKQPILKPESKKSATQEVLPISLHSTHFVSHWWDNTWADTEKRLQLENVENANGWRAALRPVKERVAKRITTASDTVFTDKATCHTYIDSIRAELETLPKSIDAHGDTVAIPVDTMTHHFSVRLNELEEKLLPGLPDPPFEDSAEVQPEPATENDVNLRSPQETIRAMSEPIIENLRRITNEVQREAERLEAAGDTAGLAILLQRYQTHMEATDIVVTRLHPTYDK